MTTEPQKLNFHFCAADRFTLNDPSCLKAATNFDKLCKTNPITKRKEMNVNKVLTKDYENKHLFRRAENKPKQTQFHSPFRALPPNTNHTACRQA
ncbi:MAG: hypothetical protein ACYS80_17795 [Planctomycetota bacterium]|jgi:hypothetical protein